MTIAKPGAEFKEGESVTIKVGTYSGKSGKITKIYPSQGTVRGTETRYGFKVSGSSEIYRAQDLQKG